MGKQRCPQVCLQAPSRASEPWRMAKPHRGAPGALTWAPHRPEPQPNCSVFLWAPPPRRGLPASASAEGVPAVLAAAQKHKGREAAEM